MRAIDQDEELIGSTELARAVAPTLERAATHPVTIRRDKGDDVTMVRRESWLRSRRAEQLEQIVLSLALATAQRFGRSAPAYPAEMYWLEWLDDQDYVEFCQEFVQTVRDVVSGHATTDSVGDMAHAWEQTAFAMRDPHLVARFTEARRLAG